MLIPQNDVSYSQRRYTGDPKEIVDRVMAEWRAKIAPPPEVLAKAFGVQRVSRTTIAAATVTYLFKVSNLFGVKYCVGWEVTEHPLRGGPPEGKYKVVAPCSPDTYEPYVAAAKAAPVTEATPGNK